MLEKLIKNAWEDFAQAQQLIIQILLGVGYGQMSSEQFFEISAIHRYWQEKINTEKKFQALKDSYAHYKTDLNRLFLEFEPMLLKDARILYYNQNSSTEVKKRIKGLAESLKDAAGADPEWETIAA